MKTMCLLNFLFKFDIHSEDIIIVYVISSHIKDVLFIC